MSLCTKTLVGGRFGLHFIIGAVAAYIAWLQYNLKKSAKSLASSQEQLISSLGELRGEIRATSDAIAALCIEKKKN